MISLLSGCNLYSGVDKPKGDPQLLSAARACLDRGDYECAKEYYNQLSDGENDTKLSELAFTEMAETDAFSIRDLITSLGSDRGGGNSFLKIAELMASRGKTDGNTRAILQSAYASVGGIQNTDLKSFMQFITALGMFNEVLANAVGTDGVLTASDLAQNPTACASAGAGCALSTDCNNSVGAGIDDGTGEVTSLDSGDWTSNATLTKLQVAAAAASDALANLSGNNNYEGILETMNQLDDLNLPANSNARCKRMVLLTTLFNN